MRDFLKSYKCRLTTKSPVFVGSGKEILKKEYLFIENRKKVAVVDTNQLYNFLAQKGKAREYEKYLLLENKSNLSQFLNGLRVNTKEISPFYKYTLESGDYLQDRSSGLHIMEFVKDVYGCPYIPGSTIKGMLRTAILSDDCLRAPDKYKRSRAVIADNLKSNERIKRTSFLKQESNQTEATAFRTLDRGKKANSDKIRSNDAVNDILQGLIISDSKPLSTNDLVLCQRVEKHVDGREKRLNVLRECIRPDTDIEFTISIDTSVCPLDVEDIIDAINSFMSNYYECFASHFSHMDKPLKNYIYVGGGVGFVSKTVVYPLYGEKNGLAATKMVFNKTVNDNGRHKHRDDSRLGVSPHILKCTYYNGKLYEMGLCKFDIR